MDNTHLLAIFDASTPEVILGSEILKFTPAHIIAHTYGINENLWKKATAPITPSLFIGPPVHERTRHHYHPFIHPYQNFMPLYTYPPSY